MFKQGILASFFLVAPLANGQAVDNVTVGDANQDAVPRFHVEILVFKRTDPALREAEKWPDLPLKEPEIPGIIDFISPPQCLPDIDERQQADVESTENSVSVSDSRNQDLLYSWLEPLPCPEGSHRTPVKEPQTDNSATESVEEPKKEHADIPVLPTPASELEGILERLQKQQSIKILQHTAWLEEFPPNSSKRRIRLIGGKDWSGDFSVLGLPITHEEKPHTSLDNSTEQRPLGAVPESSADSPESGNQPTQQPLQTSSELWELDGIVTLYRKRYIHAELDLRLREPATREIQLLATPDSTMDDPLAETTKSLNWQLRWEDLGDGKNELGPRSAQVSYLRAYGMAQQRRLRSGELHYFDHPLLGVLLWITPVSAGEEESAAPASEDSSAEPSSP